MTQDRSTVEQLFAGDGEIARLIELYHILVFATSKMVWRADAEGNITTEVPGWEQLTGQTFDEYKDFGWLAGLHPDDVEPTSQIWQRAIATHTSVIAEYRLRTVAGDYRQQFSF